MKKIAAVTAATVLTVGAATVAGQAPADAYGLKPTVCQILGAGHNARTYVRGANHTYPFQVFVKAPGAVPRGPVRIVLSGTVTKSWAPLLSRGTVNTRVVTRAGLLTIKIGYPGHAGFMGCTSRFTVRIK